ncbi:signal recognition particle-docking protein FtsY [Amycolatopsis keratiniphila]|nr:signal recognition particle-docking protein FtsY [Amycolatopsis keratiniphila]
MSPIQWVLDKIGLLPVGRLSAAGYGCEDGAVSSTPWFWIVVVAVVVLVAVLVAGLLIARRRRISLDESKAADVVEKPKGGGYTATGGIALAPGGEEKTEEPEHPVEDRPETDGQPAVGDDAAVPRDSAQRTVRDVELPEPTDAPEEAAPAPAEEIAPAAGRLERLRGRLGKSRSVFGQSLLGLLGAGDLDEDSWQDVEDTLLMADLGAATTTEIVERLRDELKRRAVRTSEEARAVLQEVLTAALSTDAVRAVRALPHTVDGKKQPAVVLVAGVNGTGKTTTTGKLARVLVAQGSTVVLGAADTFRAAAADQLQTWAERVGAEVVRGKEGADPAAVAFDAVKRGTEAGVDTVLVDTAGRLHTKTGLMDELGKVKRVVEKQAKVDEVLLVLDATTGQNGLMQARVFSEVIDVTGIVLTKLDGTAKGGIVFQVQRELGVPVKLVGLGEGPDDLAPFEPGAFVEALLSS